MKVGIQTIVDYNNYGNRLQNYAMQTILESYGFNVVTLKNNFINDKFQMKNKKEPVYLKILSLIKKRELIKKIKDKIDHKKKQNLFNTIDKKRSENFRLFTQNYIKETDIIFDVTNQDRLDELCDVDFFVIGSDQVWNYSFPRFSDFDFLLTTTKPKISYAASFGVSNVPNDLNVFYAKGLNSLLYISVREKSGKNIVERLSEKKADVVLDPTLLLDKKQWEALISKNKQYKEPFILTYFLNSPDAQTDKYIKNVAQKNNFRIKSLGSREDEEMWTIDPSEFVNLFSQAQAIFTDSFHACVFSIIFEKYFEIFERNTHYPSMNSRIDTLLSDLSLEDRWHEGNNGIYDIDYSTVAKKLSARRQESFRFLDTCLEEILSKGDLKL
ncbi:MAG: polysaccharide pyruvyl transferase family protein [Enterococcus gallinarum]|nr:polysaccharide pyruvyl transferase family protein [Enterococcus gallinarum]